MLSTPKWLPALVLFTAATLPVLLMGALAHPLVAQDEEPAPSKTVRAWVQPRPGAEPEQVEMPVYEVPVDPPSVAAREARLPADDLVIGVVADGVPMAWPVRFLALSEVVDDRVGEASLAPTW